MSGKMKVKNMKTPDKPSSKMRQAPPAPRVEMTVKLYFQQNWRSDVRVFQTDNKIDFRKFVKQIKQVLRLRDNDHILIKWQDSSSDYITVSSDSEMQLATKNIRQTETLNICVQLQEEVSLPTLCDKCDQTIICNVRYKCDSCVNFMCCVRCYQSARDKTAIHEHELYKEKFPCYCPMHRISETDVQTIPRKEQRPLSALPPRMLGTGEHQRLPDRSASLPSGYTNHHHENGTAGRSARNESMEDLMQGLNPTSPSYTDLVPDEHNYRTAERSEMVCGPQGEMYRQQRMSVFQSPESGVVAIRSRRCRETRSKSHQLG